MLEKNKDMFSMIFHNSPLPTSLCKQESWVFTEINDAWCDFWGCSREEVIGYTAEELNFLDSNTLAKLEEMHLQDNSIEPAKVTVCTKSGSKKNILVFGQSLSMNGEKFAVTIIVDITNRKHTNSEDSRNQYLLQLLIEHAPAAIAMFDRQMKYLVVSRRFLTDYGLLEQNIIGKSHYEVFPEISDQWKEIHRRCIAGASDYGDEDPFPRSSGKLDWIKWEIRPWLEKTGETGGIFLFSEVITEHRNTFVDLQESEKRYRALFEENPQPMWVYDLETLRFLAVNDAAIAHYGYSQEEFLSMTIKDIRPREDIPQLLENISRVDKGLDEAGTWHHIKKNGSLIEVEIVSHTLMYQQRCCELVLVKDVTEQIQAEQAHQLSEGRYRTLFEYSNIGMLIADQESYYIDANPCICQMLGYTREEMIGLHASDIVTQAEIQHIDPELAEIKNNSDYKRIWQFRCKDGSIIEADVTATVLPDGNLLGIIRDHTDQRRAEKERADLEAQLQQAQRMESIGRLAGGVAHDFNNMLSVILGYADLALEKVDKNQPFHSNLIQIREAAQRSANLTRQLLAFARKQTVALEILDLNDVIGDMLKMMQRLIGENVDLGWVPGENLGLVKMDPSQVDQILANLCINARDAISSIGKVSIETGNAEFDKAYCDDHPEFLLGKYVMIAVSDDGAGMDQKTIANIFEPYFSTKKAGEGSGLGLSTVYGIVKQNRGFINVYSEPGHGTTFKIYLARHKAAGDPVTHRITGRTAQGGSETILLVEDEEMILDLGESILHSLGYRVLIANRPGDALRIAREQTEKIDLLVTDVVMPDMNGWDLADHIQAMQPEIKILFMSGYTANIISDHGVLEKDINFVPKPFSRQEFAAKIREALDK